MRQAAVEAYLEAKNIKNKYLLDDILSEDENSNYGENEEIDRYRIIIIYKFRKNVYF